MKVALGVIGIAAACTIGAVSSASAGDDPVAGKSVAPAGKNGRIVFRFHNGTDFDLYTMLGDGSQMTNLTPGAATDDRDPEFSPNAQKIVFRRQAGSNRDVFVMNADGSGQLDLTSSNDPGEDLFPTFSPDGKRIAYTSSTPPANRDIWVMKADGSGKLDLTPGGTTQEEFP